MSNKLAESYFKTTSGHSVSYSVEYKDAEGKTLFYNQDNAACFAPLRRLKGHACTINPVAFYFSLHAPSKLDDVIRDYWSFIFDAKVSPWRSMLKPGETITWSAANGLVPTGIGVNTGMLNIVRVPVTKDTNPQMLISLGIASRIGSDVPGQPAMFGALLKGGWSPLEAMYASHYVTLVSNRVEDAGDYGGYAFSTRNDNEFTWMRDSTPKLENLKFGDDYGFLQGMWYKTGERYSYKTNSKFHRLLAPAVKKYDGVFAKRYKQAEADGITQGYLKMPSLADLISKRKEIFDVLAK